MELTTLKTYNNLLQGEPSSTNRSDCRRFFNLIVYWYLKTFSIMDIKKDKRGLKYFQRSGGFKCANTKAQAMKDISKDGINDPYYTQNYLGIEYIVLLACSCKMQFISINTCLL